MTAAPLLAPLAFLNLGPGELIVILLIVLLLFGAKKLPELARGLGKSMSEFKRATREAEDEVRHAVDDELAKKEAAKVAPKASAESQPLGKN